MLDPVITSEGVAVVHLFCTRTPGTDDEAVIAAVKAAQADDVQVVTPNPASSGSAKWNLLAAYGAVVADGGTEDDAKAYMTTLFDDHIAALPDSGRDATTAFTSGTGDVLLSYENEAILARLAGEALAPQKRPRLFLHHAELPRGRNGKLLRRALGPATDAGS